MRSTDLANHFVAIQEHLSTIAEHFTAIYEVLEASAEGLGPYYVADVDENGCILREWVVQADSIEEAKEKVAAFYLSELAALRIDEVFQIPFHRSECEGL